MADIRRLALTLLCEQEAADKYVNLSLSSHKTDGLSDVLRGRLTALIYTVTERRITYDYMIGALSGRSLDKIDPYTLNVLRLGACQILHMRSIPSFAAVNETVKLCRNQGERSFVNGVLRALVKTADEPPMPPREKNLRRYLSVRYSIPLHTVRLLSDLLGIEECERLLEYWDGLSYTDLTVNTVKCSAEDYLLKLNEDVTLTSPASLRISHSVNPERLPGFAEGEFFVQDRASLASVVALAPKAGEILVDTCACPGGKSFAAAVLMQDSGRIYSFDLHESKLPLISSGAARLGLRSVIVMQNDATAAYEPLIGSVDKVICDVPCSGLGVLAKKPDLRYKSAEAIDALPPLQLQILTESAKYLRRGGEMIYSTCTLNPAENSQVVAEFLRENPDFERVDFITMGVESVDGELTLIPHIHHTDGFFIAKLRRRSE